MRAQCVYVNEEVELSRPSSQRIKASSQPSRSRHARKRRLDATVRMSSLPRRAAMTAQSASCAITALAPVCSSSSSSPRVQLQARACCLKSLVPAAPLPAYAPSRVHPTAGRAHECWTLGRSCRLNLHCVARASLGLVSNNIPFVNVPLSAEFSFAGCISNSSLTAERVRHHDQDPSNCHPRAISRIGGELTRAFGAPV